PVGEEAHAADLDALLLGRHEVVDGVVLGLLLRGLRGGRHGEEERSEDARDLHRPRCSSWVFTLSFHAASGSVASATVAFAPGSSSTISAPCLRDQRVASIVRVRHSTAPATTPTGAPAARRALAKKRSSVVLLARSSSPGPCVSSVSA